ncbi:MAG: OmpH family outer membrane protein [Planctomycetaceae bacterium]|nr:OmpH family outer membrane protein [Planctomycetaceae bacterium]
MKAVSRITLLFSLCTALFLGTTTVEAQQSRNPQYQPRSPQARPANPARTSNTAAQRQAAPSRPVGPVAVVDITQIFKDHTGFKSTMERMKQEVQAYEGSLRTRHETLQKKREQLTGFRAGSPDYVKLERSIADETAKLSVDTQLKKKEFLEREARVYFMVYKEVSQAIAEYSRSRKISLVLRYNGEKISPDDRNSVLAGVNRAIVYQNNLDITAEITDRLNRVAQKRPTQGTIRK